MTKTPFEANGGTAWTPVQAGDAFLRQLDVSNPHARAWTIGKSVEGRDIVAAAVGYPEPNLRGDVVLVVATQHGREPAGRESSYEVYRDMVEDPQNANYLEGATWVFVPLANPDGFPTDRNNKNGVNLNREWGAATEPEAVAIMDLIAECRPVIIVDLHEWGYGTNFTLATYPNLHHNSSPEIRALALDMEGAVRDATVASGGGWVRYPSESSTAFLSQWHTSVNILFESKIDLEMAERAETQTVGIWAVKDWHEANATAISAATAWPGEPDYTPVAGESGIAQINGVRHPVELIHPVP